MCYTPEDSKNVYLMASLVCGLLVFGTTNPAVRALAAFLWFVAQMQLLDWAFWNSQACDATNQALTTAGIFLNHLQPAVFLAAQALFGISFQPLSLLAFAAYVVAITPYTVKALVTVHCTRPEGGIMRWKWNMLPGNRKIYFFFLASLVATSFNFKSVTLSGLSALISTLTILIAMKPSRLSASVGRLWCYYAAVSPLALLPWV